MARGKKRGHPFEKFRGTRALRMPDRKQRRYLDQARKQIVRGFMTDDDNVAVDGYQLARKTLDEIAIEPWYGLSKGERTEETKRRSNFYERRKKPGTTHHHAEPVGSGDDPGEAAGE